VIDDDINTATGTTDSALACRWSDHGRDRAAARTLAVHSAITRQNLLSWLLALHLGAIAIASYVAITADCDGDRLRALFLSFDITGSLTALSAAIFLVRAVIKGARIRDFVLFIVLLLIGLDETRMAANGWELLRTMTA